MFVPEKIEFVPKITLWLLFQKTRIGMQRKIDLKKVGTLPDSLKSELINAQAKILDCPELRAIQALDATTDRFLFRNSNPSVFRGLGIRQVTTDMAPTLDTRLREYRPQREALVATFTIRYADITDKVRDQLGPVMSQAINWPNPNDVGRLFGCSWRWISIVVPIGLDADLAASETLKSDYDKREQDELVRQALRSGFQKVIDKILERITPDDEGKRKIIRDSTIENFREFIEAFPGRYTTEDRDLEKLINKANLMLAGVSADDLKNPETAASLRPSMVDLAAKAALITRSISFDDDDDMPQQPAAAEPAALGAIEG